MSIWKFLGILDLHMVKLITFKVFFLSFLMNGYVSMTTLEFVCLFTVPCSNLLKSSFKEIMTAALKLEAVSYLGKCFL